MSEATLWLLVYRIQVAWTLCNKIFIIIVLEWHNYTTFATDGLQNYSYVYKFIVIIIIGRKPDWFEQFYNKAQMSSMTTIVM